MKAAQQIISDTSILSPGSQNDTIRLWESYRDQAALWRALSLLQVPVTALALLLALVIYSKRSVTLEVPREPLPGTYVAQSIPDTEFLDVATSFVNLVTNYQPRMAERQFREAQQMLVEPMLTTFESEMITKELPAILNTQRTQMFLIDPVKTKLVRNPTNVQVIVEGERIKSIAGRELPIRYSRFTVTMRLMPRHPLNPYGIVITDINNANVDQFGREDT